MYFNITLGSAETAMKISGNVISWSKNKFENNYLDNLLGIHWIRHPLIKAMYLSFKNLWLDKEACDCNSVWQRRSAWIIVLILVIPKIFSAPSNLSYCQYYEILKWYISWSYSNSYSCFEENSGKYWRWKNIFHSHLYSHLLFLVSTK